MEVFNPKTLPSELINICNYYSDMTRRPINLISQIYDHSSKKQGRRNVIGQYVPEFSQIFLYLYPTTFHHAILSLPPGLGQWIALLDVFLHEFGHHLQQESPYYINDYGDVGYWNCWPEKDARNFAFQEIHRLAELDSNLFAPLYTRELGYLGISASQKLRDLFESNKMAISGKKISILREAHLRAIHVEKNIKTEIFKTETKMVLTIDPNFYNQEMVPPEPDDDSTESFTPVQDFYEQDYDVFVPDRDEEWENKCPDPEEIESSYLYQSGLIYIPVQYGSSSIVLKPNPIAKLAEQEGIVWADKLGRKWRYLRLGQAVSAGILDDLLLSL